MLISEFKKIPLSEATKPKNGYEVIVDHWWGVVDECLLFYIKHGVNSPQCNIDKRVVESVSKAYKIPNIEVRQVPVVFIPRRKYD